MLFSSSHDSLDMASESYDRFGDLLGIQVGHVMLLQLFSQGLKINKNVYLQISRTC